MEAQLPGSPMRQQSSAQALAAKPAGEMKAAEAAAAREGQEVASLTAGQSAGGSQSWEEGNPHQADWVPHAGGSSMHSLHPPVVKLQSERELLHIRADEPCTVAEFSVLHFHQELAFAPRPEYTAI